MKATRWLATWAALAVAATAKKQPNFLVILTDDQDWHMNSLEYMPFLRKYVLDEGTLFDHHYCTVSICCPSRVNIWTGRAAHNTNVTDLFPPYGGYPKFVQQGLNENWLPVWLQQLGYNTYYTGKLFNAHNVDNYNDPYVNGFNGSDFLLDPYTYEYYNAHMTRNGAPPVSYAGQYSTDVIADKALSFLDDALTHSPSQPFFLAVAPIAPHSDNRFIGPTTSNDMPRVAPRHAHLFPDYHIPRTPNFNPGTPSGVSWVRGLPRLNSTVLAYHDEFQRARLRALQAVDEMVEALVRRLDAAAVLDDTYVLYTTDNGYHISQHRLSPGKECPFEEDVHVPLAIRGPGVPRARVAGPGVVSSHSDLAPTILGLAAGGPARSEELGLDGRALPLTAEALEGAVGSSEHVNVEFWGLAIPEGKYGWYGNESLEGAVGDRRISVGNNTYKALRVIGEGYSLAYTVWCTGESEFYDMKRDPSQMHNYLGEDGAELTMGYELAGRPFEHVVRRLDSLLMVLKSCKADSCRSPWKTLHPDGEVQTLNDALHGRFDSFYQTQPKVSFSSCQRGYLISEEGPQHVKVWEDEHDIALQQPLFGSKRQSFQYHGDWSLWT